MVEGGGGGGGGGGFIVTRLFVFFCIHLSQWAFCLNILNKDRNVGLKRYKINEMTFKNLTYFSPSFK